MTNKKKKKPEQIPNPPIRHELSKKHRKGVASAVPCPWCGNKEDWRSALETGQVQPNHTSDCEWCGNIVTIVAIKKMPVIELAQFHGTKDDIQGF